MKRITFLMTIFFLTITSVFAQEGFTLTGVVTDDTGIPLPGADVMVKGTTNGTVTDFDGKYTVQTTKDSGILKISYIGFIGQEFDFSKTKTVINAQLKASSVGLKEVMLIASRAVDRKTPVAVSTIDKEELEFKLGNQEFVEILKTTPGVTTTQQGGGFGDAELTLRGFNSENVAVLINGIPVNDMEDGRVFWSNWAGLGNVTSSTQIQRGLGASKLAVQSIGGTMNIITETTDAEKGGFVEYGIANDGYRKAGVKLSTGELNNGFVVTAYVDRTYGDGFVDGTPFESVSYFGGISKEWGSHKLSLTGFGTKQEHGTRFTRQTIADINDESNTSGIKFNEDWGIRNGELFSMSKNFFHKPQIALNHFWDINDDNKLSSAIYYSRGTGGVEFDVTSNNVDSSESIDQTSSENRFGSLFGPVDVDKIVDNNILRENQEAATIMQANRNNHSWWGALSNLNSTLSDYFDLTSGLEFRYYRGESFREVTDLLGGAYYFDDADVNSTDDRKIVGDIYGFNNDAVVVLGGAFGQLEYNNEKISAFFSGNFSNTSYQRIDYFAISDSEDQSTDWINFPAFGAKGGANYRLNDKINVFGNIGYFERAPFFEAVFPSNDNNQINEEAENQKIFSAELGYGYRSENFNANVNIYRTRWNDRSEVITTDENQNGERGIANITGVDALHQGIEFDAVYRPCENLEITGMLSVGDWKWKTPNTVAFVLTPDRELDQVRLINIDDVPVGRSNQTTSAIGVTYKILPETRISLDYTYYGRYYADFDVDGRGVELEGIDFESSQEEIDIAIEDALNENEDTFVDPVQLSDYFLFDISFQHKFKVGPFDAVLNARMNNIFDEEYITYARDNSAQIDQATVHFGRGRTFSVGTKVNF